MTAGQVADNEEGQEEHRGAPQAAAGQDEGQGQGRPEEPEVKGIKEPGEEVGDGLDHLVGIKALHVVGADFQFLLHGEEPPGEVADDQSHEGDGQVRQAADPARPGAAR